DGQVPAGVTVPAPYEKYYGQTETTPAYNIPGYAFDGWRSAEVGDVTPGASFTMPAQNVTLRGMFTALTADYVVEHYLMNDAGNYLG
ncbi:MAG: hypothetical protein IKB72_04920, partial [Ruminococcus sp.]|nr:hypothetical protein [Ruminococcus sp.]